MIRNSVQRFSEKLMTNQAKARCRFGSTASRFSRMGHPFRLESLLLWQKMPDEIDRAEPPCRS
jgi:hypothetical protein